MQSLFLHRYAAHRMFTMSRRWEKVFYLLTFIGQGSSFLSPRAYGIMHRLHHRNAGPGFSDTEQDPHSPDFAKNVFDQMERTSVYYGEILNDRDSVPARYKKGVPYWPWLERFAHRRLVRIAWGAAYTLFYIRFATSPWLFMLLPVHYLMGPIHGLIISWFAHRYGYKNFALNDKARNLLPVDFLMMDEAYHNNHHKYSTRPNMGIRWHEFDPTYALMKGLAALRIIHLRPMHHPVR